jgi:protein phosphatase
MSLNPIEMGRQGDPGVSDWEKETVRALLSKALQEDDAEKQGPRPVRIRISSPDAVAVQVAGQCDCGMVRSENQDTVKHAVTPLGDLLIVSDGMGGYAGGGVASRMTVEAVSSALAAMPAFFPPSIAIQEASSRANADIAIAAAEPDTPNNRMGSTVVVALLRTDPDRAHAPVQATIGHIGDSRAYAMHHGRLACITRDHSVVQDLIDRDLLTVEESRLHPDASVLTRCLGWEPHVEIELDEVALEVGDSLLLCSDGLWGFVPESEIERVLADSSLDAEAASRALLYLALAAGGHDNIGIELARVGVPAIQGAALERVVAARPAPVTPAPFAPLPVSPQPALVMDPFQERTHELAAAVGSGPILVFPSPQRHTSPQTEPVSMPDPVLSDPFLSDPVLALRAASAARPQHRFIKFLAIFLLTFGGSCVLTYLALLNNWFGLAHLLH